MDASTPKPNASIPNGLILATCGCDDGLRENLVLPDATRCISCTQAYIPMVVA